MLDRQTLTDAWRSHFKGYDHGYFITLNSKMRVDGTDDRRAHTKHIKLDTMVQDFVNCLNKKCFGRRYDRKEINAKLKCLVGYEVGSVDGLIHCHLIAAHDGSVVRTSDEILKIARATWKGICRTGKSKSFVHVADLDKISDRIWYLTKQSTDYQRRFGELNILPL